MTHIDCGLDEKKLQLSIDYEICYNFPFLQFFVIFETNGDMLD